MMVDVQSANAKLERRKRAMVSYLTGCSDEEAQRALECAGGNVKISILILHGCELASAQAALDRAGGHLRQAIDSLGHAPQRNDEAGSASSAKPRHDRTGRALPQSARPAS